MESALSAWSAYTHPMSKRAFPLDRLSIDLRTGKYYYDLNETKPRFDSQFAVEDGFCSFKAGQWRNTINGTI